MKRNAQTKRAWDDYDAYLFDIDGTLVQCTDAVHYFAFCETLNMLAGRPLNLDGVTAHGNTDVGILRDALALARIPDAQWRPRLAEAKAFMGAFVRKDKENLRANVLPFVPEVLNHLSGKGALLGLGTGNLEAVGRLKLESCGLLDYFQFGGYSDDFEVRSDVVGAALDKARLLAGKSAAVCVVGDTPADVQAAKANGLEVIAVATGVYTLQQLAEVHPDFCVSSLEELPFG